MQDIYHTIVVDLTNANQRFDRFLRKFYKPYTTVTLPTIYSWIRKWYIRINDKKWKEDGKVILWDKIIINITKTTPLVQASKSTTSHNNPHTAAFEQETISKNIIQEDDNRLVFNKPPHILMHPGSWSSQKAVTMNDWLYSYLNISRRDTGEAEITKWSMFKPSFCFRLDKDTSGVLIAAKQYDALQYLNKQIKERHIVKWYVVVVQWKLPKKLTIDKPLFKWFHAEKGRAHMFVNYEKWLQSKTHMFHIADTTKDKIGTLSLWLVRILTWRMHQIRVHAANEWFPVLWDKDYGNESITRIAYKELWVTRQLLHSFSYSFHDIYAKKEQTFIAPLPNDIKKIFWQIDEKKIQDIIQQHLNSSHT